MATSERREIDATCSHDLCEDAGEYLTDGRCENCGSEFVVRNTRGHETRWDNECPDCGCDKVRAGKLLPAVVQEEGNDRGD